MCKHLLQLQAALAMCVGVGSFSDPWSVQGVAHFLEHMVFMGSEKYPRENDFSSFIDVSICCYIMFLFIVILSNMYGPICILFPLMSFAGLDKHFTSLEYMCLLKFHAG
jgi:hypothetical protein